MWEQMMHYFQNNMQSYLRTVGEHITISLSALLIAVLIGVPAGFICVLAKRSQKPVVSFFQVLRVIPSLAILLLLIPIMGTGIKPALVALVLLAIPPILMNTVTGLEEVPKFMLETATAHGMTPTQVWQKVRIPLALPMILTGIKTALVEVIASATLAAKIGAGGLGEIIFTGLGLYRYDLLLIGGISVAILSISASLLFEQIDRWLLKYKFLH